MKSKSLHAAAAAIAVTMLCAAAPALAQSAEEAKALPSAPTTRADRTEARKERLSATAKAQKQGQVTPGGEAAPTQQRAVSGTRESRQAERAQKRKEVAAANKAGQLPQMGEAGEPKK
ncbi:MAG: hypothetical protein EOO29_00920 [Comamonadaceae bacterium]|nr:MAG: hypothetical protein EOO29_00920 [Comamonadaceae bacterium]